MRRPGTSELEEVRNVTVEYRTVSKALRSLPARSWKWRNYGTVAYLINLTFTEMRMWTYPMRSTMCN